MRSAIRRHSVQDMGEYATGGRGGCRGLSGVGSWPDAVPGGSGLPADSAAVEPEVGRGWRRPASVSRARVPPSAVLLRIMCDWPELPDAGAGSMQSAQSAVALPAHVPAPTISRRISTRSPRRNHGTPLQALLAGSASRLRRPRRRAARDEGGACLSGRVRTRPRSETGAAAPAVSRRRRRRSGRAGRRNSVRPGHRSAGRSRGGCPSGRRRGAERLETDILTAILAGATNLLSSVPQIRSNLIRPGIAATQNPWQGGLGALGNAFWSA